MSKQKGNMQKKADSESSFIKGKREQEIELEKKV